MILESFKLFGLETEALPWWETRGHAGVFTPRGVLLGSGLDLGSTTSGRPGVAGPVSNFHVDKDGKVTAIARRISHCAGKGSGTVLGEVRRGFPIRRNAAIRELADNTNGDSYFVGIMLEEETDVTITAGLRAAAAICAEWSWSPNRVIHARSWTKRREDLAFKGDIWGRLAELLNKHSR